MHICLTDLSIIVGNPVVKMDLDHVMPVRIYGTTKIKKYRSRSDQVYPINRIGYDKYVQLRDS